MGVSSDANGLMVTCMYAATLNSCLQLLLQLLAWPVLVHAMTEQSPKVMSEWARSSAHLLHLLH